MRKRILVVSDDPILAFSRVALLKKAGYQVESIPSDEAAMDLLEIKPFDLVLLGRDSLRPGKGLDRRLRERHPDLLTLKIEGNVPVPSAYPSRITDARPENVLAALEEMLLHSASSAKAPSRGYKPARPSDAASR
jgi:DNA-binding NtrC family response regulator